MSEDIIFKTPDAYCRVCSGIGQVPEVIYRYDLENVSGKVVFNGNVSGCRVCEGTAISFRAAKWRRAYYENNKLQ